MYDSHSRESRGFGFVTMETAEEADAAITAMNGTELMGKAISVEKVCVAVHPYPASTNFFVTGATWPCTDSHPRSLLRTAEEERMCAIAMSINVS